MTRGIIPYSFGSAVMLTGAFVFGWAIHIVLVEGEAGPLDAGPVLAALLGGLLMAAGYAMERRFDPSDYVPGSKDEEEEEEDEFDEELAAVPEDRLDEYERDDSRGR